MILSGSVFAQAYDRLRRKGVEFVTDMYSEQPAVPARLVIRGQIYVTLIPGSRTHNAECGRSLGRSGDATIGSQR